METKKIGLVLSGGGHRGVAHAGAIKALEEYGIFPNLISGSSAGALVGALYAADYKPEEMIKVFKNLKIFNISRYARKKPGFVDTNSFYGFLATYFPENSFKFKKKELFITATDLVNAKIEVFKEGNLINSILASASFPGVFTPMSIDNCLFADGGILDNFPVGPIKQFSSELYGIYVSPVKKMKMQDFKHAYNVLDRAFHLRMHQHSVAKFALCDTVIYPHELSNHSLFNANHLEEIFEIGYHSTIQELQKRKSEQRFLKKMKV